MLLALAAPATSAADTATACAAADNSATVYCPVLQGGTDDESALFAGLAGGVVVGLGICSITGLAYLYRRIVNAGLR
jgi:hypothetical protein